ncbi:uncharacterized protein BDW47DRAFT_115403 [Aspergillus candidus]|uniref:Zn(2)-C6 fungal-type domain-containing protein n=1 Tax=Aspergillus candidus TaxID=41067 RepID=A0A2I2FKT5_ASPCN|nr:hypothetical protein BDW47DRAFT_115403 [Aspergillus candidus]PLB41214.1 hypothetical protein BDW47DRAFT_115403 [Aspergillus candidus]
MADRLRSAKADKAPSQSNPDSKVSVRLTCELCRQRKVKCDKLDPCTNCRRIGTACVPVQRARLPRGKSGRHSARGTPDEDETLRERVSRLEELVRKAVSGGDAEPGSTERFSRTVRGQGEQSFSRAAGEGESSRNGTATNESTGEQPDRYLGVSFWAELLKQLKGSGDHVSDSVDHQRLLSMANGHQNSPNPPLSSRDALQTTSTQKTLCQIFLQRVDPCFKILHRPSVSAFLLDGKPYLDYKPGHEAPTALAHAIYYSAISRVEENECWQIFQQSKSSMITKYQKECESALANADVVTTNDLTVLQAFVLSLLSSHSQDRSRRVWTMLSVALRVAQALYLHLAEPPFPVRPFDREMRRRLWLAIGFLDMQSAADRASEPMMQVSWLQSHPPTNTNDSDLTYDMETPPRESPYMTDMTYNLMTLQAQRVSRLLNSSDFIEPAVKSMPTRQQLVIDFQQTTSRLLHHAQPTTIPFHWFTRQATECTYAAIQLLALRPLQRIATFTPPRIRSDHLIQAAVDVVAKSQALVDDPRAHPWRWMGHMFVPWHGLAVAIAELCICDDPFLWDMFWAPVERAYGRLGELVADSRQGMLWKPMEKLMARAQGKRETLQCNALSGTAGVGVPPVQPLGTSAPDAVVQQGADTRVGAVAAPDLATPESMQDPGVVAWPSVWDTLDFSDLGGGEELSWLNYENFIDDVYDSVDWSEIPH